MNTLCLTDLGRTRYGKAWDLQRQVFALRTRRLIPDLLLLTEHNHVYTLGKGSDANHLLAADDELRQRGIDVFHIDRGGDVTYHGPGQLVGYPILDLSGYYLDIHRYLRDIEEVLIRTLARFGITAHRDSQYTGVWVGSDKIAAIGVKVSRWITMHGFALNANTDLTYFDHIIPCGIFHKGVTSMHRILGRAVPLEEVARAVGSQFAEVFGVELSQMEPGELARLINTQSTEDSEWPQEANQ